MSVEDLARSATPRFGRARRGLTPLVDVPVLTEALLVAGAALVVSVVTTWPLAVSLQDLVHDPNDPLFQAWQLDWVQHAVGTDAPLWEANIFAGNARTLAYSEAMVGAALALLPARWLGLSPVGVLNVGVLVAYASSAAAGYVFGRVVSGRVVVAACTGIVFAFGPYNTSLGKHLNIVFHPGPALAAACAWALADRRAAGRPTAPLAVGLAVVVALQGTVSFYTCAISVVAAAVVLVVRVPSLGGTGLAAGAAALIAAGAALLPLAWPYLQNARSLGGSFRWELEDLRATGADFLAVDPTLSVWGDALGAATGTFGQPTFPGLTVLVLAVYGLCGWRQAQDRRPYALAVALVTAGVVLGLGTSDEGWRRYAPYRLVYEHLPGGDGLRAPGRYWLVGLLGLGLLAGIGVERLVRRIAGRHRVGATAAVVAACCALVLVEGHRPWGEGPEPEIPSVDKELARLPGRGGVVYLPVPLTGEGSLSILNQAAVVHGTTAHRRPTPNGYGSYLPDSFFSLGERLAALPEEDSLDFLRRAEVRYVVVAEAAGRWQRLRDPARAAPLQLVGRFGDDLLYEVPRRPGN